MSKTIVLCSSAAFYEHVNQIADELEVLGFKVVVPHNAKKMKETGNYNVEATKTWYKNPEDFKKKTQYMRWHFDEIAKGDMILVVNDKKRSITGYIGPNVLLEMGLAFYLNQPIYILHPIEKEMQNYEEIIGMNSVCIDGELKKIQKS